MNILPFGTIPLFIIFQEALCWDELMKNFKTFFSTFEWNQVLCSFICYHTEAKALVHFDAFLGQFGSSQIDNFFRFVWNVIKDFHDKGFVGSEFESKYSLFPGCQKASFSADGPIANDRFEHGDILELEDFGYGVERRLEFFLHIQHHFSWTN